MLIELNTFLDLLSDAFFGAAVGRIEGFVATERASSGAAGAITVLTGETGIDTDFLDAGAEEVIEVTRVGVDATVAERSHKDSDPGDFRTTAIRVVGYDSQFMLPVFRFA